MKENFYRKRCLFIFFIGFRFFCFIFIRQQISLVNTNIQIFSVNSKDISKIYHMKTIDIDIITKMQCFDTCHIFGIYIQSILSFTGNHIVSASFDDLRMISGNQPTIITLYQVTFTFTDRNSSCFTDVIFMISCEYLFASVYNKKDLFFIIGQNPEHLRILKYCSVLHFLLFKIDSAGFTHLYLPDIINYFKFKTDIFTEIKNIFINYQRIVCIIDCR